MMTGDGLRSVQWTRSQQLVELKRHGELSHLEMNCGLPGVADCGCFWSALYQEKWRCSVIRFKFPLQDAKTER
jgi:hypothetical protein